MKEYASALLALALLLSVGGRLLYDQRYASVTGLLFSLILLVGIVTPLREVALGEIVFPSVQTPVDTSAFDDTLCEAYEEGIRLAICEKFSLSEHEIAVRATDFSPQNIQQTGVEIVLSGRAALADRNRIQTYLTKEGVRVNEIKIQME